MICIALTKHLGAFPSGAMLHSELISHLDAFTQQDLYYNTLLSGYILVWCIYYASKVFRFSMAVLFVLSVFLQDKLETMSNFPCHQAKCCNKLKI